MKTLFTAAVSASLAVALACGPALSGMRGRELPPKLRHGKRFDLCQAGTFEQRQYDLEHPDQRQKELEQPSSQRIDGKGDDQRQYDLEEPDQRQQDLERPRYDYD